MSAWIVDYEHIEVLVTALVGWEFVLPDDATETGRMLWQENVKSIHSRYPDTVSDKNYPGPIHFRKRWAEEYKFVGIEGRIDPWVVERAASCYAYQSCEHEGWGMSRACRLVTELRDMALIRMPEYEKRWGSLGNPGFDTPSGAWGYNSTAVFIDAEQRRAAGRAA